VLVGRLIKESSDNSRFTIDATQWLDVGETIVSYTAPVITQVVTTFPGPFPYAPRPPYPPEGAAPADTTPLVVTGQYNLGTTLEFFVGVGTPLLSYQFQLTLTGTSSRIKTVEVFINIIEAPGVPYLQ
jgi:hypothetical protein